MRKHAFAAKQQPTPANSHQANSASATEPQTSQIQKANPSHEKFFFMRRGVGNRAIARAIGELPNRQFESDAFKGDAKLEEVLNNKSLLKHGSSGDPVTKVQSALERDNIPLPKFGVDGKFGGETTGAVKEFQSKYGLQQDGIVGPITMDKLDERNKGGNGPGPDPKPDPDPKPPDVDPELAKALDYLSRLIKGEDIFAGVDAKARKETLDLMQKHLTDAQFTQAASLIILNVPESVVEDEKARKVAMGHLEVLFKDKTIARNLIDKNTVIVVVPRNKKMTDLPQFASLKGKKTFDGRNWEDVRGSGGLELDGKIYVAVTEENTLGTDAEGDVSGTQWCYASGYSTTTHETAHVIDMHGLTAEDRKKVDDLYKAKKDKQANGELVEWVDGFDYDQSGTKKADAQAAFDEWKTVLPGKLITAGMTEEADRNTTIAWAKFLMVDGGAYTDNTYTAWLKHVGVISNTADKINKKDGTLFANINATSKKAVYGGKQTCYASSHRLEYFAQSANAFFGTNAGTEPYVYSLWEAAGEPEKGKRRNGKSEVGRIEPELKTMFERIFGNKDITDANPRDKVKQEKEAKANAGAG